MALPSSRTTSTVVSEGLSRRHLGRATATASRLPGFTLVELLVVVTIIALLIALLLPAVQAARGAARRAQCMNNLKQIGLAMHMYHEEKNTFPFGHLWNSATAPSPEYPGGGCEGTWITCLLPYLGYQVLYGTIDWRRPFSYASDQVEVGKAFLPVFMCPAIGPVGLLGGTSARGTYAANNGMGPMMESDMTNLPLHRCGGVFYMNSSLSVADVRDGLSNTVFVSEIRAVPGKDIRGKMHYPEGPLYQHNYTPNSAMPDQVRMGWCVSLPEAPCDGSLFNSYKPRYMTMSARSAHGGGVHALLGDGGVRFVKDSVNLKVWRSLSTPQGGEVVAGDAY